MKIRETLYFSETASDFIKGQPGEVRTADIPNLSRPHHIVMGVQHFLDRRYRIEGVKLEQIAMWSVPSRRNDPMNYWASLTFP